MQNDKSPAERKRQEILAWKGKLVTLSILNTGRAVMLVGPVAGTSAVTNRLIPTASATFNSLSRTTSESKV
jgi:hypothetical protein